MTEWFGESFELRVELELTFELSHLPTCESKDPEQSSPVLLSSLLPSEGQGEVQPGELDAVGYGCNVADEDAVKKVFADIKARWGRVDILVTAAGIVENFPVLDYPADRMNSESKPSFSHDAFRRQKLTPLLCCSSRALGSQRQWSKPICSYWRIIGLSLSIVGKDEADLRFSLLLAFQTYFCAREAAKIMIETNTKGNVLMFASMSAGVVNVP